MDMRFTGQFQLGFDNFAIVLPENFGCENEKLFYQMVQDGDTWGMRFCPESSKELMGSKQCHEAQATQNRLPLPPKLLRMLAQIDKPTIFGIGDGFEIFPESIDDNKEPLANFMTPIIYKAYVNCTPWMVKKIKELQIRMNPPKLDTFHHMRAIYAMEKVNRGNGGVIYDLELEGLAKWFGISLEELYTYLRISAH